MGSACPLIMHWFNNTPESHLLSLVLPGLRIKFDTRWKLDCVNNKAVRQLSWKTKVERWRVKAQSNTAGVGRHCKESCVPSAHCTLKLPLPYGAYMVKHCKFELLVNVPLARVLSS